MTIALLAGEAWVEVAGVPASFFFLPPNLVNVTIHPCVIYSEMRDYGASYLRGLSGGDSGYPGRLTLAVAPWKSSKVRHLKGMDMWCLKPRHHDSSIVSAFL